MIDKIITPQDVLLHEISNNESVLRIIEEINKQLSDAKSLSPNINCEAISCKPLTNREVNLVKYVFKRAGWTVTSNIPKTIKRNENEEYKVYTFIFSHGGYFLNH